MAQRRVLAAYLMGVTFLPSALCAQDLPTDPTVVAGDISISNPSAQGLQLDQTSQYGIVDWGSFSIGQGFGVAVNNGTGVTLNRVTGGDLSSILGSLSSTGSVFLINPNGIVVGKTGVINTGGRFVATTLDLSNSDLLDGGDATFAGNSDAAVVNLGQVSSLGGDVALLARHVVNEGTVLAPDGTVALVAGREILMRDAAVADGLFAVKVGGSDTDVTDAGAIRAAAVELQARGGNVYALAGNTDSVIEATGVAKVKGRVFLTAGDQGKVTVDKTVKASEASGAGGQIAVRGGTIDLSGRLEASGTAGGTVIVKATGATDFDGQIFATGGEGGFVEVSGSHLVFAGEVDTGGGTLLLDPDNIEITDTNSALLVGASTSATLLTTGSIQSALATGNLIIDSNGATGEAGTILVTNGFNWNSTFSLTLLAAGDILFNESVQNDNDTGGDLNIVAGWDGTTAFDPDVFSTATLASQTLFGNQTGATYAIGAATGLTTSGSVQLGGANSTNSVAVGTRGGTTQVYARNLTLTGGQALSSSGAFAQLGYNISASGDQGTILGDILVRAVGNVVLQAGTRSDTSAQIGHIGTNLGDVASAATADTSSDIFVEAGGDVQIVGGTTGGDDAAFAMIGHGSLETAPVLFTDGTRSGDITVQAANIAIELGDSASNDARIGHQGSGAGDTTMTATGFYDSVDGIGVDDAALHAGMLANDTAFGDVFVTSTGGFLSLLGETNNPLCGCATIQTTGNLVVRSEGTLALGSDVLGGFTYSNGGGGNLIVSAGGFLSVEPTSQIGPMGPGVFQMYSTRPDQNSGTVGDLGVDSIAYGLDYDPLDPLANTGLGNALIYSVAPVVTVGPQSQTYGDTFVPPSVTVQVGGVDVDPVVFGFSVDTPAIDNTVITPGFFTGPNVNVGTYAGGLTTAITGLAAGVPAVTATVSGVDIVPGDLTVTPATIFVSLADQSYTYDGIGGYSGTVTFGGFVGADTSALITAGPVFSFAGGDASGVNATTLSGPYTVSASGMAESSGNYVFDTTDTALLTINQATVTASLIGTINKIYDGSLNATLTAGNFQLLGFLGSDGATVTQTAGTYATKDAAGGITVSATLGAADFAAGSGTILANYALPALASGTGSIDQRALTATITGTPVKVYDGNTDAVLTAADYDLTGLVAGESITVLQTAGLYASRHVGGAIGVTALLGSGDFAAGAGTSLANYILPASALGEGSITQRALAASIIGLPTKPFDGTRTATLTEANFDFSGFILGEGVTVTQKVGQYDTDQPGTRSITASLSPGDFTADAGTDLNDYALPVTATGPGQIGTVPPAPVLTPATVPFETTPLGLPPGPADQLQLINTETTQQIIDEVNAGVNFCREFVGEEYAIDCLSDRLQSVADGLSTSGEYSEVRAALEDAARKLHDIALTNASSDLAQVVARSTSGAARSSSRPLTAIRADALLTANAEARAIIENTQVILLRSGEDSARRRVAFQQVGQIVGTTATLLRSS